MAEIKYEGITSDNKYKVKFDLFTQSYEIIKIDTNRVIRRFKSRLWVAIIQHCKSIDVAVYKSMKVRKK